MMLDKAMERESMMISAKKSSRGIVGKEAVQVIVDHRHHPQV